MKNTDKEDGLTSRNKTINVPELSSRYHIYSKGFNSLTTLFGFFYTILVYALNKFQ